MLPADQYGKLPSHDQLDALKPSSSTTFTAVGYGLQQINPVKIQAEKIRMFAEPHLIQIDGGIVGDFSLLLSNNASTDRKSTRLNSSHSQISYAVFCLKKKT